MERAVCVPSAFARRTHGWRGRLTEGSARSGVVGRQQRSHSQQEETEYGLQLAVLIDARDMNGGPLSALADTVLVSVVST